MTATSPIRRGPRGSYNTGINGKRIISHYTSSMRAKDHPRHLWQDAMDPTRMCQLYIDHYRHAGPRQACIIIQYLKANAKHIPTNFTNLNTLLTHLQSITDENNIHNTNS